MAHDIEELYLEEFVESLDPLLDKMNERNIPYILAIVTKETEEFNFVRVSLRSVPARMAIPAKIVARFEECDEQELNPFAVSFAIARELITGEFDRYPELFDQTAFFKDEILPGLRTLSHRLHRMGIPHAFFACPARSLSAAHEFLASYVGETESPLVLSMHQLLCKNPVLSGATALEIATRYYTLFG